MARYTGPTTKIARKFGEPIFGSDKNFEKRNYPPGQHGLASKRKKQKEYGQQLKEKQKVRYMYGLLERQFHNTYLKATRMSGQRGENLLFLLESRLDNVVYRMGIAPSRAAARQLVNHAHITLNGEVCNIPSAQVKPGDVVAARERSKSLEIIQKSVASATKYSWIEFDPKAVSGKFLNIPSREDIPETINEQLIVDLYSK
ncbi:MAG: 30S ribosomal protein S4 [Bacteroidales bacterium]|nr:30S ribosomal protein S4 [Bacteroidales bacterium]MBO6220721.1 30S ribosomal protein S4 [Bacteroidales bacterium]MBQ5979314.1 30S ribosomal protein S4 [Bacteroidales bacterium]MBQ6185853.1 30S ribosomal protein S4 [Bacteroidales bacterium]